MKNKRVSAEALRRIALIFAVILLIAVEVFYRLWGSELPTGDRVYNTAMRLIGGVVCVIFMVDFSFGTVMRLTGNKSALTMLAVMPAFLVAVNNFPFVSFLAGDCSISAQLGDILLYAAFCLSVGFFEEMAFRGCVLMILLKKRTETKSGIFMAIFLSSAVFGLVHLVNLFTSSPGAVLLQIGYSALIGALCSVVLLTTKNIWICVLLHSVYNFAGGVVPEFGSGHIWTAPEVALTAVIGVAVAIYYVWYFFFKMPKRYAAELYVK